MKKVLPPIYADEEGDQWVRVSDLEGLLPEALTWKDLVGYTRPAVFKWSDGMNVRDSTEIPNDLENAYLTPRVAQAILQRSLVAFPAEDNGLFRWRNGMRIEGTMVLARTALDLT